GAANGTWQYNLGSGWNNIGAVSSSSALLLRSVDSVRFVPNANFNGTASISYFAWDQSGATAGGQGTKVDPGSPRGGASAFSTASDTATVNVTAVNDTPTATAQNVTTTEDTDKTITLLGDDGDAEVTQTLTFTISSLPTDGKLYQTSDGTTRGLQF